LKKLSVFFLIVALLIPAAAFSKDVLLTATVKKAGVYLTKSGKQYVRIIITEQRQLNGIQYEKDVVVTAFRPHQVQALRNIKPGDTLKAIADKKFYRGRVVYNIIKVVR